MLSERPLEIFWGTGGVGKTTMAASRAFFLGQGGTSTLLITIDPSYRLKQVLGDGGRFPFDYLLFSPRDTFRRIVADKVPSSMVDILMGEHGGMSEIMAVLEIQHQLQSKKYATIVLDTAPGKHFLDFLSSATRIRKFFGKGFRGGIGFSKVFNMGVKKVLKYVEQFSGKSFVEEFLATLEQLGQVREGFMNALELERYLQRQDTCHWFLVTSCGQDKLEQALMLANRASRVGVKDDCLIINRSLKKYLDDWNLDKGDALQPFKESMTVRESKIRQRAEGGQFRRVLTFPEVLFYSPTEQVAHLAPLWKQA